MNADPAYHVTAQSAVRTIHVASAPGSRVRLSFSNDCSSDAIFDALQNLVLPLGEESVICMRYALVELVANAVRASRDHHALTPVRLTIWSEDDQFRFELIDHAGGFDPAILPYDFYGSADAINLESDTFDAYRARNGHRRFGIGLVMARRAVEDFRLDFLDADGCEREWASDGSIKGTVVRFSMKMMEKADDPRA